MGACARSGASRSRFPRASTMASGSRSRARARRARAAAPTATCTWDRGSRSRRARAPRHRAVPRAPITFPQAALGATLTVPTVEGTEEVASPPASSPATRSSSWEGRAAVTRRGRGDLHVVVNVVVPSKLSKRERELLRQLDEVSEPAVLPKGGPRCSIGCATRCSADRRTDALAGAQRRGRRGGRRGRQRDPRPRCRGTAVQPTRLIRDPADELAAREDPTAPFVVTAQSPTDRTPESRWTRPSGALAPPGLRPGPGRRARVRSVEDADWTDAWKRHYVPQRIGRVVIVPSWIVHEAGPTTRSSRSTRDGLRHRTAPDDSGMPRAAPGRRADAGSVLDVGAGSGSLPSPHSASARVR